MDCYFIGRSGKAFLITPDISESPEGSEGARCVDSWWKESQRPAQAACLRHSERPWGLDWGMGEAVGDERGQREQGPGPQTRTLTLTLSEMGALEGFKWGSDYRF